MFPDGEQGKRNDLYTECTGSKVSKQYISQARHVLRNAGQKAMSFAAMNPEPDKGGRGNKLYSENTVTGKQKRTRKGND